MLEPAVLEPQVGGELSHPDQVEGIRDVTSRYWSHISLNARLRIGTPDRLLDFLTAFCEEPFCGWRLVTKEAAKASGAQQDVFFRGQASLSYGISSTLFRAVRQAIPSSKRVYEYDLATVEMKLIEAARNEGLGRNMTDGQLLMIMQHHGMPTRLIDVSRGPLEALYFAVESGEDEDGALFIIHTHETKDPDAALHKEDHLPWRRYIRSRTTTDAEWSQKVAAVDHLSLDPRMHAQDGVFLVGGLAKSYPGWRPYDRREGTPDVPLTPLARPLLTNLAVNWMKNRTDAPSSYLNATGWVIRINADWKRRLRARLSEDFGINRDSMYPPLTELARLSTFLVRQHNFEHR